MLTRIILIPWAMESLMIDWDVVYKELVPNSRFQTFLIFQSLSTS